VILQERVEPLLDDVQPLRGGLVAQAQHTSFLAVAATLVSARRIYSQA
jgi:hypothetical protein